MNAKLILTTIQDHLTKQGIATTYHNGLGHPHLSCPPQTNPSTNPQSIHITVDNGNTVTIDHVTIVRTPKNGAFLGAMPHITTDHHWNSFTNTKIPLAHPQLYQKITRLLHQVLNDPA